MGLYPPLSKLGKRTATTNQIVFGCFAEARRGIHYFRVLCPCLVRLSSCVAHFLFLLQKTTEIDVMGYRPPAPWKPWISMDKGGGTPSNRATPFPFPHGHPRILKISIVYQICHRARGVVPNAIVLIPLMHFHGASTSFYVLHGLCWDTNARGGGEKHNFMREKTTHLKTAPQFHGN